MATAQKRTRTDHGEVVVVLGVERETERGPAGHARGLEVLVAAREHELAELAETAGRVPVAARVEVRAHEQHVELRLVLQRALDPARLALQVLGGLRDERFGDLWSRGGRSVVYGMYQRRVRTSLIFVISSPPVMIVVRISMMPDMLR